MKTRLTLTVLRKSAAATVTLALVVVILAVGCVASAGSAKAESVLDLATGEYYKPLSKEERAFWLSVINNPDSKESLPLELIKRAEIEKNNELYGTYYQELIEAGYTDENILRDRGAWLYAFENFVCAYDDGTEYRLSDFGINRDDVLTGEGLNVYECENGRKIWFPNFSEQMTQGFVGMIDWFKSNGGENIEDFLGSVDTK
jgi:hypothetical protein